MINNLTRARLTYHTAYRGVISSPKIKDKEMSDKLSVAVITEHRMVLLYLLANKTKNKNKR